MKRREQSCLAPSLEPANPRMSGPVGSDPRVSAWLGHDVAVKQKGKARSAPEGNRATEGSVWRGRALQQPALRTAKSLSPAVLPGRTPEAPTTVPRSSPEPRGRSWPPTCRPQPRSHAEATASSLWTLVAGHILIAKVTRWEPSSTTLSFPPFSVNFCDPQNKGSVQSSFEMRYVFSFVHIAYSFPASSIGS